MLCRFSNCNLWSGKEKDRQTAICKFCDTDFLGTDGPGGGYYTAEEEVIATINSMVGSCLTPKPYIVFTGGEPALQLTNKMILEAKANGYETAIETNGTTDIPNGIDWITVSPKAGTRLVVTSGNELKLVWPQPGISIHHFEQYSFDHYYLQPKDGLTAKESTREVIDFCLRNPLWKLSIQTHKYIGIR